MEYILKYKAPLSVVSSQIFHPLSKNGPYLDAHFGPLNTKTPVGQTFYARPISEYIPPCVSNKKQGCGCGGKGEGYLKIKIKNSQPFVHLQKNEVTDNVEMSGYIKIEPFEWEGNKAKVFESQVIEVNLKIKNLTGLKLQGFHIHDGVSKGLLTGFGPISYFIFTSRAWQKVFNLSSESKEFSKKYSPLPQTNTSINNPKVLLSYSEKAEVKKI